MDRRSFLRTSAIGTAAAASTTLAAPLYAQGNRTLTMVTTWGRGLAGVHDAAMHVANSITEMTDGQLTVDVRAAGELVGAFEVFDAVSSGQADMYHGADYYFVNQHPGYAFFTAVPFGMTAQELADWYYHAGGQELHDELGQIFGLKSFLGGNTGAQSGGWFRNEITGPEDFQGLRFRMPGLGGQALGRLGASVQNLPGGEVYQALASGAIDGTEWIGPWADQSAGFQEITQIYYTAGFHEPGAGLSVAFNRDVFDSFTPAQQKICEVAAAECHQWNLAQFLTNNGAALQQLVAGGVQVRSFPDSVWDAFGRASQEVLDENMSDELFARIRNSAMESMAASSAWIQASEGTYRAQRDRVLG
ncbi:TRAP transporter substrate-binding protein [Nioella nitratireducens]|jgi:TRAP-type mannitol/chloroaromatic compound transport system substrate-binding protein|uniref:TRAP transporter substrate-binding protein n=1 Tax=Nioella nitratireducens TaxID=1287720 RepID=UPI0008FD17BF|nr:TRAP transporter substrate-binding protein [Nioella nitratireducens]